MLGVMMVNWKCQGYPKQLWLFILLVCIQCTVPALMCVMKICQWGCASHPTSVGMCFSSHPVPFICLSLRDCFCPSLNSLCYQPFILLGTLILLLQLFSFQQAIISVSFPSDAVSSTFLTFFQVLVENACDVTVVGQLHWLWPVLFVALLVGT